MLLSVPSHNWWTVDLANKFFTRVDVTEEFPFLVTKISPYYDH
jgi:PatG C-terminal